MVKKKTEDEANYGTSDNPVAKPERWEAVQAPSAAVPNSSDTPEKVAADYLESARLQLEHIGHFETNQAIVSIDAALEWLKKCEGQRT